MTTNFTLSPQDAYGLARVLVGMSRDSLPLSPAVALLLAHLDPNVPDDLRFLRKVLGQELLRVVLAVDPNAPPPPLPQRAADLNIVPELPESAQLTETQVREAAGVGRWLDDYVRWAGSAANETPLAFHLGAGLYLAAIAVGRRLYIHTPWRQQVFPNLYLMVVAVSTYYRKSAGLSLAAEVARLALPHMLMPQPGSPENFMSMLGGILPPNFADIPQLDRARLEKGNRYAAQRGLLRDELSGLFKSMGRDYMAGLKELIMTLYDCPAYLDSNTNNKGLVVIRDAALSILGAATPAELSSALSSSDWFNGNLARFALLTPEPEYKERPAPSDSHTPNDLATRLRRLHERLPEPPLPDALGEKKSSEAWSLSAAIWRACHAYEQALRAMTAPSASLDDRLRAIYGRLHVQAIKVAILLAALDLTDDFGARLAQLTDDDIDLLEQSYPDASYLRDTLPAPYDVIQLSEFDVQAFFSPPDSIVELGEPLDTDLLDNLRGTSILPTIDEIFVQQIDGFNIAVIDFADYAFLFDPTQEPSDDGTIAIPMPGAGIDPEDFLAALLLLLLMWLNLIRNIPLDWSPDNQEE